MPEFASGAALIDAVTAAANSGSSALLVAHPTAEATPVNQALATAAAAGHRHFAAVIGPEGGLTDGELRLIEQLGGVRVRLGAHILRVETAGVAVAAHWAALS